METPQELYSKISKFDLTSKNPKHHILDIGKINELSVWELIQLKDLIECELRNKLNLHGLKEK